MTPRARRRGEPLLVLGLIVMAWIGARAAVWSAPFELPQRSEARWQMEQRFAARDRAQEAARAARRLRPAAVAPPSLAATTKGSKGTKAAAAAAAEPAQLADFGAAPDFGAPLRAAPPRLFQTAVATGPVRQVVAPAPPVTVRLTPAPVPPRVANGHALLWMAALGRLPLPEAVQASLRADTPMQRAAPRAAASRWSADGWLLLREGGGALAAGSAFPRYGANQMGAVVRYRLDTTSAHRPALHLRASAALNGSGEREVAAGLSGRPLKGMPISVGAELRASRMAGGTHLRPAVFAVTELPRFNLPAGMRAEAYAQAGYVGGPAATAFVDGQLKIDRHVAQIGPSELRAGAGAWGGAQQGSGRLDIGPSASLGLAAGRAGARLGLDWRFRVAGAAAPASGPALTLSAGF